MPSGKLQGHEWLLASTSSYRKSLVNFDEHAPFHPEIDTILE